MERGPHAKMRGSLTLLGSSVWKSSSKKISKSSNVWKSAKRAPKAPTPPSHTPVAEPVRYAGARTPVIWESGEGIRAALRTPSAHKKVASHTRNWRRPDPRWVSTPVCAGVCTVGCSFATIVCCCGFHPLLPSPERRPRKHRCLGASPCNVCVMRLWRGADYAR